MTKPKFIPRPPESPEVIEARWNKKKERLEHLSNDIRRLRLNVTKSLGDRDNEKEYLTSLAICLMDKTGERVGNEESASNGHYGVTGLRKKHIKVNGNQVTLKYTGKSEVDHEKTFSDQKLASNLEWAIDNSPSQFVFTTSEGFRIKGDRVNRYLKEFGISSKNLRGYTCNNLMSVKLNALTPEEDEKKRKKQFNKALKEVAGKIGHGKGTLKKHYLIPELYVDFVEKGKVTDIKNLGYFKDGGEIDKPLDKKATEKKPSEVFKKYYSKNGGLFFGSYF
jgi:DNA topoisomerase-1